MYGYIYKTTNLINNKFYIGKKKSPEFLHEKYLGSGKIFKQAVAKYGRKNFAVQLIDTAESLEELDSKEQYWIAFYNAQDLNIAYNIHKGGSGGAISAIPHIQTLEERQKRSISLKLAYREGRHEKISNKGRKLRKRTAEENKQNSARQQGKVWIHNDALNSQKTVLPCELESHLNEGWALGRYPNNKPAWNKNLTHDNDARLAKVSEDRKQLMQERGGIIGCFGRCGTDNKKYKSDEMLKDTIINKGLPWIWATYGKESARVYFHTSKHIIDRCLNLCSLKECTEHTRTVIRNKKGFTEEQIQQRITEHLKEIL